MATYDQTAAYYANQRLRTLRGLLRDKYGPRKYRITKNDEVHAFGTMPNTEKTGWYFAGYLSDFAKEWQI